MLPEVRAAIDAAAQQHVHLDELMAAIGARLAELTKAEWGMVASGCAAGADARDRGLRRGRQSRSPRPHSEPERICQRRSHHPETFAQRLRRRDPRCRRAGRRRRNGRRAGSGVRPADRDGLHPRRPERGQRPAEHEGDRGRGAPEAGARPGRCRRRDPDGPERAPGERRHARRLQRRQVPARPAERRLAARAQGSGAGRVGPQRAASRLRPIDESRQGRSDRHADGGRDVDAAGSQGRMEPVALVARPHREAGIENRRRDDGGDGNDGAVEPDAVSLDPLGRAAARRHGRRGREAPHGDRAAHRHAGRRAIATD